MSENQTIIRELNYSDGSWKNYYLVCCYCSNCGKHDRVYVKKGVKKKGLHVACEHCDCEVDL